MRVKDQQLQLKAGIVEKEKLVREFTDKVFVLEQRISQLGHELQTDRNLVSELEKPIISIQARIGDGRYTVNENNELLPADIFKWPEVLEKSFVREPVKWASDPETPHCMYIGAQRLRSKVLTFSSAGLGGLTLKQCKCCIVIKKTGFKHASLANYNRIIKKKIPSVPKD